MRPLATSEKTLFMLLCGAVFLAVNMLGLRVFIQAKSALRKSIAASQTELASDRNWIELGTSLQPAQRWIESHPMPLLQPDGASALLLKTEREEAESAGLKVAEENLISPQSGSHGETVGVSVKLTGPFGGIVRMLFALQTPVAWRTVEKLTLRSDSQPPNVIADLELRQYFRTGNNDGNAAPEPSTP
jgi:hypothetical protein